jgi:hypothetical protein
VSKQVSELVSKGYELGSMSERHCLRVYTLLSEKQCVCIYCTVGEAQCMCIYSTVNVYNSCNIPITLSFLLILALDA